MSNQGYIVGVSHVSPIFPLRKVFPLLPDTSRHLSFLYNAALAWTTCPRQSLLVDKSGIVRWIDKDVHVQTHGADVLAKMGELGLNAR